jgi:hypothetical protein
MNDTKILDCILRQNESDIADLQQDIRNYLDTEKLALRRGQVIDKEKYNAAIILSMEEIKRLARITKFIETMREEQ